ncbi:hypothetical protein BDQ12DRAFT_566411, partial [Crucibulum laeve]
IPELMIIAIEDRNILFDTVMELTLNNNTGILDLRGIIYSGENHFNCQVIDVDGSIWFHDGITTQSSCLFEGHVEN